MDKIAIMMIWEKRKSELWLSEIIKRASSLEKGLGGVEKSLTVTKRENKISSWDVVAKSKRSEREYKTENKELSNSAKAAGLRVRNKEDVLTVEGQFRDEEKKRVLLRKESWLLKIVIKLAHEETIHGSDQTV
jgi:hypothetical protein